MSRLVWADGVSMVWFRESNNMLTECRLVASGAAYYQLHMQSTPWYVYEVHPFAFKSWSITYQSGWCFGTWILCFHILGIILPYLTNIFQDGWNHQPVNYQYTLTLHPLTVSTLDAPSQLLWALNCWNDPTKTLIKFLIIQTLGFLGIYTILLARLPQNWIIHKHNPFIPIVLQKTLWKCVQGNHKPALKYSLRGWSCRALSVVYNHV